MLWDSCCNYNSARAVIKQFLLYFLDQLLLFHIKQKIVILRSFQLNPFCEVHFCCVQKILKEAVLTFILINKNSLCIHLKLFCTKVDKLSLNIVLMQFRIEIFSQLEAIQNQSRMQRIKEERHVGELSSSAVVRDLQERFVKLCRHLI